jgi:UDP-N-acetylglucosamine 3-dehydrogenase
MRFPAEIFKNLNKAQGFVLDNHGENLYSGKRKEGALEMNFAIIGAGKFAEKRANVISKGLARKAELKAIVDIDIEKAKGLAKKCGGEAFSDYRKILDRDDIDSVIVATPNKFHCEISKAFLDAGKNVLCEKPVTKTVEEAQILVEAAKKSKGFFKTGSNHWYFPNVQKAKELLDQKKIGKLIFARGWIGNNGKYVQKSWFWDKDMSGGGTFLDNGCHIMDIFRWLLGEVSECKGYTLNNVWPTELEDTGFALYKTIDNKVFFLQSSWVEWSGYMYMEFYGTDGFIFVDSRFHNTVTVGNQDGYNETFDFSSAPPVSHKMELLDFIEKIGNKVQPSPGAYDGMRVVQMVHALYEASKTDKTVRL